MCSSDLNLLKTILFAVIFYIASSSLAALEVSLQGAKENHKEYSTLYLRDSHNFLCQEMKDDFDVITKVVCAFSKSPSKKLTTIQNNFFKINTQIKNKTFFLIIEPHKKMKLYPMIFDLTKDETIFSPNVKMSKQWMLVGYEDSIPYVRENDYSDVAIDRKSVV